MRAGWNSPGMEAGAGSNQMRSNAWTQQPPVAQRTRCARAWAAVPARRAGRARPAAPQWARKSPGPTVTHHSGMQCLASLFCGTGGVGALRFCRPWSIPLQPPFCTSVTQFVPLPPAGGKLHGAMVRTPTKAANQVGPRLSVARNSRHWCDLACVVAPQLCPMAMLRSVDSVFNTLIKAKGHLTMSVDFDSVRDPYYPRQLTTHHCSAHTLRKAGWCQRHIATDTSHFRVLITA